MLEHIFSPLQIGALQLKNRFIVPAMASQYCGADGTATERYISYHEEKARGGWGLIITENYAVDPHGGAFVNVAGLWCDEQIPGHRLLVERVHSAGGKICCQLYHAGRATHPKTAQDGVCAAPSAVKDYTRRDYPRALDVSEIHGIVRAFGDAAARAKAAGFDMLELHGAHGYLIGQFLSPFSNRRTDEYGGSTAGRSRFLLEVIQEVRTRVGADFPLQLRLSADEYVTGGITVPDAIAVARLAQDAGIDSLHVSQGHHASTWRMISPSYVPHGAYRDNAAAIKAAVSVPVIGVGRITDPLLADGLIAGGYMDAVAMGRASLADPALPRKAAEGALDRIHTCIGCLQGCAGRAGKGGIVCVMNPSLGRTQQPEPRRGSQKKILVAGGGAAGCEAAIAAAKRGHTVSLYERQDSLGGLWRAAAVPCGKAEFVHLLTRQRQQLQDAGVAVHLNASVDEALLRAEHPDLLVIATGTVPKRPPIPGIDGAGVVTAEDVLLHRVNLGKNVVIIGGGLVGCETAAYAAEQNTKAVIVEQLPVLAKDGEPGANHFLLEGLRRAGVGMYPGAHCTQIGPETVSVVEDGAPETTRLFTGIDQVILAVGAQGYDILSAPAERLHIPHLRVGSADGAPNGLSSVLDAYAKIEQLDEI